MRTGNLVVYVGKVEFYQNIKYFTILGFYDSNKVNVKEFNYGSSTFYTLPINDLISY